MAKSRRGNAPEDQQAVDLSDRDKALPIRVKALLGGFRLSERLQDMSAFDRFVNDNFFAAGWTKQIFLDSDQDRQWQYFFYLTIAATYNEFAKGLKCYSK